MKIAEVIAVYPPYFGGMGNSCMRFSTELAKLGHKVHVYTSNYPKVPYTDPKSITVHRLKHQFKYGNAPLLLGLFKIKNVDVIHLHYPFYFGAEIIYLNAKLRRIPYVVTYHMDMVGSGWLKPVFALHKKLLLKTLMNGATQIYVSSEDYGAHSDLARYKTLQHKIAEVPLGVDIHKFHPQPPSARLQKKLGLTPEDRVIMFIGQLDRPHYFKGVHILLEAFSKLKREHVKLILVGDGDMRPQHEAQAKRLGIDKNVIFAGAVDNDHLNEYLSLCEFTAQPSTDKTESFGMVLLEAQAAGKGVIASNFPGVRSVVREGKDALLCKPNDPENLTRKIEQLIDDRKTTKQFGTYGRKKAVDVFSWEHVTELLSNNLRKEETVC